MGSFYAKMRLPFSAKRQDPGRSQTLISSAIPCHDSQVVGLYQLSCPVRLIFLAAMSEDYTNALEHLQYSYSPLLQMVWLP